MTNIKIFPDRPLKPMKPMHAGGQPPLGSNRRMNEYFHYLTEAGIPYSRLHDVGGAFGSGRFVDIPNIFRDFEADENDPASYDFAFTDLLIENLVEAGVEPYFRLGVTIECQAHVKYYHIAPPKDVEKWARVCEHIVRHYTEGWADGYRYSITYWEIWNEPDDCSCQPCWRGTNAEYYNLYAVTAKHLKRCFPHIKVGGYASCGCYGIDTATDRDRGGRDFFWGFLDHLKKAEAPLDFFSWPEKNAHSASTAARTASPFRANFFSFISRHLVYLSSVSCTPERMSSWKYRYTISAGKIYSAAPANSTPVDCVTS
ncbi:MAG: hypothetical protein IIX93_05745 [Clostridia bacterium]|nr:hypothetical protein [Clostridia bacterium]